MKSTDTLTAQQFVALQALLLGRLKMTSSSREKVKAAMRAMIAQMNVVELTPELLEQLNTHPAYSVNVVEKTNG